ncbi:CCE_0567 family metalloprotein [Mesorhizobium sp. M1143]|uniref:CCE_0567 family metalloprotein n=1 Tax=Mesorhizobium sp. M1143 TaxID=2957061 RepID=UPI0033352AEB
MRWKKDRKLQLRAAALRDFAEDLPGKWTEIEEVAEEHRPFAELNSAKRERSMKKLR